MYELRILNGLHRGATLPLDDNTLIIGASEDADVVLVDPDIETRHATLTLTAAGWTLSALDGTVLAADTNRPQTALALQVGDFARLGHVWVTVAEAEARWVNPPPEPVDAPEPEPVVEEAPLQQASEEDVGDEVDEEVDEEVNEEAGAEEDEEAQDLALAQEAQDSAAGEDELYRDAPEDGPMYEQQAQAAVPPVQPPPVSRGFIGKKGWRRSRMLLVPFALVTVLTACAAYTMTATSTEDIPLKTQNKQTLLGPEPALASAPAPAKPAPVVDLRAAFRERLKEVDLLRRFELDLGERSWSMHAALDDEEAARFERVLAQFIHTHNITFPVNAKVGSAEGMLPFRIRQVISGSNASIITHDGNRLYIGDTYRGVRLVAIERNQIRFDGERKIKVKW